MVAQASGTGVCGRRRQLLDETGPRGAHVDYDARDRGNTDRQNQPVKLTEADVTYVTVELSGEQGRPVPVRGV
jgi:hypothetical protein